MAKAGRGPETSPARSKVLVVGSAGLAGVSCVDWWGLQNVPNIASYPIVIVNTGQLVDLLSKLRERLKTNDLSPEEVNSIRATGDLLRKNSALLKERLLKVLAARGLVVAIVHPGTSIYWDRDSSHRTLVHSHDWLPLPVSLEEDAGEGLEITERGFGRYLTNVRTWTHVYGTRYYKEHLQEIVSEELAPKPDVRLSPYPLAKDWRGQNVAVGLAYTLHQATSLAGLSHANEPYHTSGLLSLLPPPTSVTDDEGVRILLEDCCGVQAPSIPPSWVAKESIPGDERRNAAIERSKEALLRAGEENDRAVADKERSDNFKRLLYEKGTSLQDIVQRTFEEIGIPTKPSPVSDEFMLVDGGGVLVEVTGHDKKSIAGRDLSQLMKDIGNYLAEQSDDVKGLLVGNGWANLPPDERDFGDKRTFPDDVVKTATNRNIALLSTVQLFKAYCAHLEGKLDAKTTMHRIVDTAGVVRLVD